MILIVLLLALGLFGAGRWAGRRLGLDGLEALAVGPALVLVGLWQAGFAAYLLGLPLAAVTAPLLGLLVIGALGTAPRPERVEWAAIGALGAAFAWMWCLQALAPLYDGGGWAGDWMEHYQRALFFLDRRPTETVFLDTYILPARPPAWNVLSAMGLSLAGPAFAGFQTLALFWNFLPAAVAPLFLRRWFPGAGWKAPLAGAAFVLLNPAFQRNATYPWTRGLTNYLVLAALFLYLKAGYGRDRRLALAAFLVLTTGVLAHYSAAPYLVALTLHFTAVSLRRRERWAGWALAGGLSVLLLVPWFGWAVATYGWDGALRSNSTVIEGSALSWSQRLSKDAYNAFHSLLPAKLLSPDFYRALPQPFYNAVMLFYSNSFPGGLSLTGLLLGGTLLRRRRRFPRYPAPREAVGFWVPFLAVASVLGVTTTPGIAAWGLANINFQPMLLLATAGVAGLWLDRLSAVEAAVAAAAAVVECALLGALQMAAPGYAAAQAGWPVLSASLQNASLKEAAGLVFLRDGLGGWAPLAAGLYFAGLASLGVLMARVHPARPNAER